MTLTDDEYMRLKQACRGEVPYLRTALNSLTTLQSQADAADAQAPFGTWLFTGTAAGTIPADRLIKAHTDGTLLVGTAASKRIIGANAGSQVLVTETATIGTGYVEVVAAEPIIAGDLVKCGDNGRILQVADADNLSTSLGTGTAGNFGNQPNNDGIEVVSDDAGDTTQTCTIIGTTTGTDTLVSETVTLTGTSQVATTKTDWGYVVAIKLSASCAGTVTVREASGNATIITLATTVLSAGVVEVAAASQGAHGLIPYIKAGGASTKYVGVLYEPAGGTADALMAEQLNGATAAPLPAAANLVKEIYLGDVATGTVATVYTNATEDDEHVVVGKAVDSISAAGTGTIFLRP